MSEKEKKLMPYQQKFPNGFITNKLLKKPKTRGGLVYSVLDEQSYHIGGNVFLPTWDGTDHLQFVCRKCKNVADILTVKFNSHYSDDPKYALFFYLGCRGCGATGQRKVYLDRCEDACLYQHTYDEGNVYIYGKKEVPERVITKEEIIENYLKKVKK